ncbi:MAG: EAL domain-containing protein [Bryobacter sp.]|nr:EAL domain-containing protein [Bryobacter sp.]
MAFSDQLRRIQRHTLERALAVAETTLRAKALAARLAEEDETVLSRPAEGLDNALLQCDAWRAGEAARIVLPEWGATEIVACQGADGDTQAWLAVVEAGAPEAMQTAAQLIAAVVEQGVLARHAAWYADHDVLTGLPSRSLWQYRLQEALESAAQDGHEVAVAFLDLDRFKQINDTIGHAAGDSLLILVSQRLESHLGGVEPLGRLGGDEFGFFVAGASPREAIAKAEGLLGVLREPFHLEGQRFYLTASLGLSFYPRDGDELGALLVSADAAMYEAKNRGKDQVASSAPIAAATARDRMQIENHLRRSVELNELHLHYQPVVDPRGALHGFEGLIFWQHPLWGRVPPDQFIPIAEESGLIISIGQWVLEQACRQAAAWPRGSVAVNVSAMQFDRADFAQVVEQALKHSGLDPHRLMLELTESLVMRDITESINRMQRLRALGVRIAIDDFGTGYSSLAVLRRLPADQLKVDRSFLNELEQPGGTLPMIRTIAALAHHMGLEVVAEGVETEIQRELLMSSGCDLLQGHLFGEPRTPEQAAAMLSGAFNP